MYIHQPDCSSVFHVSAVFTCRAAEAASSSLQVPAGDGRRGPLREDVGPEEALQSHHCSQTLSDQRSLLAVKCIRRHDGSG